MKRIVLFIMICLSISAVSQAQIALLDEFDFSKAGYMMIVIPDEPLYRRGNDSTDVISYFEGSDRLNEIKRQLVVHEEATQYPFACFSDWNIVVCKNGKLERALSVSNNCHSITYGEKEYAFIGFFPFKGYKLAVRKTHQFESLAQARAARESLLRKPGLIYIPDPEWLELDGKFAFFREDVKMDRDEVYRELKAAMERRYPGEKFELVTESSGGSSDTGWDYWAEVRCRKSLFDRFDLFKVNHLGWQPFPLTLQSYWKK